MKEVIFLLERYSKNSYSKFIEKLMMLSGYGNWKVRVQQDKDQEIYLFLLHKLINNKEYTKMLKINRFNITVLHKDFKLYTNNGDMSMKSLSQTDTLKAIQRMVFWLKDQNVNHRV